MKVGRNPVHVSTIRKRYKVCECHLLRRTFREGRKVRHRTVANLSSLPPEVIEVIRLALSGKKMVPAGEAVETVATRPAGQVQAVFGTMKRVGIADLLSSRRRRERDLVMGLITERVPHPASKPGMVRLWKTTLASELGVEEARVKEVYGALDWLLARQGRIEERLAGRHLEEGGLALCDATNSHSEGGHCPLAKVGAEVARRRSPTGTPRRRPSGPRARRVADDLRADELGQPAVSERGWMDEVMKERDADFVAKQVQLVDEHTTVFHDQRAASLHQLPARSRPATLQVGHEEVVDKQESAPCLAGAQECLAQRLLLGAKR